MNDQLIKFIELCLVDGVISDKEREVIFRKAEQLGVPKDECEIILEGMFMQKAESSNQPVKQTNEKDSTEKSIKKENKVGSKIILKKVKSVPKVLFDKKPQLTKTIEEKNTLINKGEKFKSELEDEKLKNKKSFNTNLEKLKSDFILYLNSVEKGDIIKLKNFDFKVDELILKSKINPYLKKHGSIEWGEKNAKLNPNLPHPVAVIFNHITLGDDISEPKISGGSTEIKLSGYIDWLGKFKYFEGKPTKIFDLKKLKPTKVLVSNDSKNLKKVIILTDKEYFVLELTYSVNSKEIEYKKETGVFGHEYKWDFNGYRHSLVKVDHRKRNLFANLKL